MEEAEKYMQQDFDVNSPFGAFAKLIEDSMDIAEAEGCPFTPKKIVNKYFDLLVRDQALPDTGTREWRRKFSANETWSNFKLHFAK